MISEDSKGRYLGFLGIWDSEFLEFFRFSGFRGIPENLRSELSDDSQIWDFWWFLMISEDSWIWVETGFLWISKDSKDLRSWFLRVSEICQDSWDVRSKISEDSDNFQGSENLRSEISQDFWGFQDFWDLVTPCQNPKNLAKLTKILPLKVSQNAILDV